jgi:hypothetical protein
MKANLQDTQQMKEFMEEFKRRMEDGTENQ